MIKITNHLRVNVLTVFMFAFCTVFRYPLIFYMTYAVMTLHEAAHCIAAVCIGLRIDYILLQPFGANLRLKNKMVPSLADEVILYISGPLVNALAAAVSAAAYRKYGLDWLKISYITNLMLFMINLLPALPLDGGVIFRRVLTEVAGFKTAAKVSMAVSGVICAALTALGVFAMVRSRSNFSVLMFASLLLGNLFTQREKYDADFIQAQALEYMTKP